MFKEKRSGKPPVPDNVKGVLNDVQMLALRQLEGFGWQLGFVRRPLFQEPVPVVFDGSRKTFGVIEETGQLNMNAGIVIRHL